MVPPGNAQDIAQLRALPKEQRSHIYIDGSSIRVKVFPVMFCPDKTCWSTSLWVSWSKQLGAATYMLAQVKRNTPEWLYHVIKGVRWEDDVAHEGKACYAEIYLNNPETGAQTFGLDSAFQARDLVLQMNQV